MSTTEVNPTPDNTPALDEAKLEAFVGAAVTDMSAAISGVLMALGDRLGLYRAMDGAGPLTPAELADRAGCAERYVREWLANQAAGGYVEYDAGSGRFTLPPEHALVLADADSPVFLCGGADVLQSVWTDVDRFEAAWRDGEGVPWGEHHHALFSGTERFFRSGYRAHLTQEWIPALDGVVEKLQAGGRVHDAGCGHGASTVAIGEAFPAADIVGSDVHAPSIEQARARAAEAGVDDHVRFEVASAQDFTGRDLDLVCTMDCLHDMGDPVGAARHLRSVLAPDGTWLLVEPFANDRLEENLGPVGRLFYAASSVVCCPNAVAQDGGHVLGAQAGPARLREVCEAAGFTRFRVALQTPFNLVLEVRP